jgi:nitrous oxidase accessory protein NosD
MNYMKKKWLTIGIILLFVGTCIFPAIAQDTGKQSSSRGNWLYVGGSGPGNYTRIQDAILDASPGDVVFVYHGTYNELVTIDKSIKLLGESKTTTMINGIDYGIAVIAHTPVISMINISGFTIQNSNTGIVIGDYENTVRNISIFDNCIRQCVTGLEVNGINCVIHKNSIKDNLKGILAYGSNCYYSQNSIKNNWVGISIGFSEQIFEKNTIAENGKGVQLSLASRTSLLDNNFINNENDTDIIDTRFSLIPFGGFQRFFTKLSGNYWDEWIKRDPKPFRTKYHYTFQITTDLYHWEFALGPYQFIKFDWQPAQEPYDIPGMS